MPARIKARPVNLPAPNFQNLRGYSAQPTVCNGCGEENLYWAWDFCTKRPMLVGDRHHIHRCPTPRHVQDIFPGWCTKCNATNLSWVRKANSFELTEDYGLPHTCEQDTEIEDISKAKCRYCETENLLWLKIRYKYTLVDQQGVKHTCNSFNVVHKDWAEAKRMDYALEKAWVNSHADDHKCNKCQGAGFVTFLSKNKRLMNRYLSSEPIMMYRPCKKCKRIGTFSVAGKKAYLANLRRRYWPFNGERHKWKKYQGL